MPSLTAAVAIASSATPPFWSLDKHEHMFAWCADGKGSADTAGGGFAPEVLEAVVLACLGREDVHDHVPVVHEDPACFAVALGAAGEQPFAGGVHVAGLLQLLVDP